MTAKLIFDKKNIYSWIQIVAGAIIAAFALEEFLSPNDIFDGGVVGVSMIISRLSGASLGMIVVIINIPFLIFGLKKMGKGFLIKAAVAMIIFSIMTEVFEPFTNVTEDIILAVCFGGVFLGIGVGLVLRGGGVLDGTEIVALSLNRKYSISLGTVILMINVVVYFVAGVNFGIDRGMYSLLMYFITSRIIDLVEVGMGSAKSVMIITDNGTELANKIFERLGRTVTFLDGKGYISKTEKSVLYCIITRAEIFELKKIVNSVEGSTFTTISEVSEIVGNHIKSSEG